MELRRDIEFMGSRRAVEQPCEGVGVRVRCRRRVVPDKGTALTDDRLPCLGAGASDDVPRRVRRRELLRDAPDEPRLLPPHGQIHGLRVSRAAARRVVAARPGVGADAHLRVQVHTAVELHPHVHRRAVGPRHEAQIRQVAHPRNGDGVRVVGVAIAPIPPPMAHHRGAPAVLEHFDRAHAAGTLKRQGLIRHHRGEGEPAAGRHGHVAVLEVVDAPVIPHVGKERTAEAAVVPQQSVRRERGREAPGRLLPRDVVARHHHEQGGARLVRHAPVLALVAEFPRREVRCAPASDLLPPDKIAPHPQRARHPRLTILPEEGNVGGLGEVVRPALYVVAVGVDDRQARPQQHVLVRGRPLAAGHVIVVMAQAIHHPGIHPEREATRLVITCQ